MKKFFWNTIGTGKVHLVLIHGWGFNSKIWNTLLSELNTNFTIHLVDLPGFGKNNALQFMNLKNTAKLLAQYIPKNAILLGWSMGGLIISKMALSYPEKIKGLISVSSSPCFLIRPNWPGISKNTLLKFYCQLVKNYEKTIENFIRIQTINSKYLNKDTNILKKIVLSQPKPRMSTLKKGLELLYSSDLRKEITKIKIPFLRIYGSLDALVPKTIAKILDKKLPNSQSVIINRCTHAPFISDKYKFCSIILKFSKYLNTS
ncbi:MAG: pimeloyl-ACP methyl ester esterase BioH [Buchnera aphidicola (Meitanaphis microgallis)]